MAVIHITNNYDVKEVARELNDFNFNDDISLNDFSALVEEVDPSEYRKLLYAGVLSCVKEEVPQELAEVLVSSNISYDEIIRSLTLSDSMINNIITNHLDKVDGEVLMRQQGITDEQFVHIINYGYQIYPGSLGECIGELRNVEYAKYIINNWNSIPSLCDNDINDFRYALFNRFGSVLLSNDESMTLFGQVRPELSSEELRNYEPCAEGWKRTYKWAGRSDKKYSWNEFIARHVLANQDNVDGAKSDLEWLAETLSDEHDYFYHTNW
ncbi:hypothetical protein GAP32_507 [Cronobacter phage vB_CsaM_GAP32]|uniref:Uncharacterized protein n=1 Tax=Cronobacter phage vB_CsaM_GAP32 TaxID=1141136 RepID=K4F7U7_9CAUD|nr:hypothetical protein GAP32_507 [Cronobacter phage vB_CsaM_GAP32]AFC21967.1 hypothetical protein GAP32_507 [Cronobacter phage vB_CsaM_GAP32]